ncbi:carcinine hydrolase/isopenicillin-N N-acyltransferase family protein [Dokdonia sp. LLG6352-1]|uniref:carcinine hydrolase/isopenicillin-N N-acyltransferase family protein n=2 Tax=unclassified Dokdonia TaxID=2615033 RepID=UPI00386A4BF1
MIHLLTKKVSNTSRKWLLTLCLIAACASSMYACSILYYVDKETGTIYAVNNEDFWLDTDAYIQIEKATSKKLARLWYGWDNFAQGGINSAGLFFDVAVTPEQKMPEGYGWTKGNIGDDLLANASTVAEALAWIEEQKLAVHQSHFLIGDATGNAVIVEWIDGKKHIIPMEGNTLVATNFLINAPEEGGFPCHRYQSINSRVDELERSGEDITLKSVGQTMAGAVQPAVDWGEGRMGGTLYTTFFDITAMQMVMVPKLDGSKMMRIDLNKEFALNKKRKIDMD